MVVEDQIKPQEIVSIPIYLPEYLKTAGNKLIFTISLSFSAYPDKGNHLNYLPLHISFNLMKNLSINDIANKKASEVVAKSGFSWSEDHFGKENIIFSNTQSKEYRLQPKDIIALNGELSVAVRCLSKENIDENLKDYLENNQHAFSIVINIREELKNNTENNFYNEMSNINDVEIIGEVQIDGDLDLDV